MTDPTLTVSASITCRVTWGSHCCTLPLNHREPCECEPCECQDRGLPDHVSLEHPMSDGCVEKAPYYGPETNFSVSRIDGHEQEIPPQTIEAALRNRTAQELQSL